MRKRRIKVCDALRMRFCLPASTASTPETKAFAERVLTSTKAIHSWFSATISISPNRLSRQLRFIIIYPNRRKYSATQSSPALPISAERSLPEYIFQKRATVYFTYTVLGYCLIMCFGTITLMLCKEILWVFFVIFKHQSVTGYLCKN